MNSSGLMARARRITALPPVEYDKPYEGRLVVTRSESQDGVRERSPKSSPLLPSTGIRFSVFSKTRIRLGRERSWYPSRNQTKTLPIDAMTGAQFGIRIDDTPRTYRDRKDFAMEAARLIKNREPVGYTAVYPEPAASNLQRRWNGSL